MDRPRMTKVPVHRSPGPGRPRSEQGHQFRHLPVLKDPEDYIWITQEILDGLQEQVIRSHTVTLKFDTLKYQNRKTSEVFKRKLPPVFAERLRMLHGKSSSSYDLKEDSARRRPVKVLVDDITQADGFRHGVDVRNPRNGEHTSKLVTGVNVNSKSSDATANRSMDSGCGDDGFDFPEDAIDTVAKANSMSTDNPTSHHHILPTIRAAPCPIHMKKDKGKGQDPFNATNAYLKELKSPRRVPPNSVRSSIQHTTSHECERHTRNRLGITVRLPEQFPSKQQPTLPKNMSSKDYVVSWLMHGTAPSESNHFPDIVTGPGKVKTKYTHRKPDVGE